VIVGPCSVHDVEAAREYARRLAPLRERHAAELEVVMRVYFEKPRTTVGWKGLINDPHLDGSYDINTGLRLARALLLDLARAGMPAATELLDPVVPQYIADLISWTAIGARTTESQTTARWPQVYRCGSATKQHRWQCHHRHHAIQAAPGPIISGHQRQGIASM
jgi:phospho-2-dehydro-3-deoxyheptonate aldolase